MSKVTFPNDDEFRIELSNEKNLAQERVDLTNASIKNEGSVAEPLISNIEHKANLNLGAKIGFVLTFAGTFKLVDDLFPLSILVKDFNGVFVTPLNLLITGLVAVFSVSSVAFIEKIAKKLLREEYLKMYKNINKYNDAFFPDDEIKEFDKDYSVSLGKMDKLDDADYDDFFFKEPRITAFTWIGFIGLLSIIIPMLVMLSKHSIFGTISLALGLIVSIFGFMTSFGIARNTKKLIRVAFSSANNYIINQANKFNSLVDIFFITSKIRNKVKGIYSKLNLKYNVLWYLSYVAIIIFSLVSAKSYTLAIPSLKAMSVTFGRTQIPVGALVVSSLLLIAIKECFNAISYNKALNSVYFRDFCRNSILSKNIHEAVGVIVRTTDDFFEKKLTKFYVGGLLGIAGEFAINNMVSNYLSFEELGLINKISILLAPLVSVGIGIFLGYCKAFKKLGESASEIQTEDEFLHKKKDSVLNKVKLKKIQAESEKKKAKKDPSN